MTVMKQTELKYEDALYICQNLREQDAAEAFAVMWGDSPADLARASAQWGPYAFCSKTDEGEPVAMIGASETWPGRWQVWMLATDKFDKIGLSLTKWVLRVMIPQLFDELGLHRGEAQSLSTHTVAHRWMEHLGAVKESTLRGFGRKGEDFVTYVWSEGTRRDVPRR